MVFGSEESNLLPDGVNGELDNAGQHHSINGTIIGDRVKLEGIISLTGLTDINFSFKRLGAKYPRPVCVRFKLREARDQGHKSLIKLRGQAALEKILILPDLTPYQLEEKKTVKQKLAQMKEEGAKDLVINQLNGSFVVKKKKKRTLQPFLDMVV